MTIPKPGYYYHYKHNPLAGVNDYAYEVVGVARHTEEEFFLVLYRPLYTNDYLAPALYQARPLTNFTESITKDGATMPRFREITDPEVLSQLWEIRGMLYGVK